MDAMDPTAVVDFDAPVAQLDAVRASLLLAIDQVPDNATRQQLRDLDLDPANLPPPPLDAADFDRRVLAERVARGWWCPFPHTPASLLEQRCKDGAEARKLLSECAPIRNLADEDGVYYHLATYHALQQGPLPLHGRRGRVPVSGTDFQNQIAVALDSDPEPAASYARFRAPAAAPYFVVAVSETPTAPPDPAWRRSTQPIPAAEMVAPQDANSWKRHRWFHCELDFYLDADAVNRSLRAGVPGAARGVRVLLRSHAPIPSRSMLAEPRLPPGSLNNMLVTWLVQLEADPYVLPAPQQCSAPTIQPHLRIGPGGVLHRMFGIAAAARPTAAAAAPTTAAGMPAGGGGPPGAAPGPAAAAAHGPRPDQPARPLRILAIWSMKTYFAMKWNQIRDADLVLVAPAVIMSTDYRSHIASLVGETEYHGPGAFRGGRDSRGGFGSGVPEDMSPQQYEFSELLAERVAVLNAAGPAGYGTTRGEVIFERVWFHRVFLFHDHHGIHGMEMVPVAGWRLREAEYSALLSKRSRAGERGLVPALAERLGVLQPMLTSYQMLRGLAGSFKYTVVPPPPKQLPDDMDFKDWADELPARELPAFLQHLPLGSTLPNLPHADWVGFMQRATRMTTTPREQQHWFGFTHRLVLAVDHDGLGPPLIVHHYGTTRSRRLELKSDFLSSTASCPSSPPPLLRSPPRSPTTFSAARYGSKVAAILAYIVQRQHQQPPHPDDDQQREQQPRGAAPAPATYHRRGPRTVVWTQFPGFAALLVAALAEHGGICAIDGIAAGHPAAAAATEAACRAFERLDTAAAAAASVVICLNPETYLYRCAALAVSHVVFAHPLLAKTESAAHDLEMRVLAAVMPSTVGRPERAATTGAADRRVRVARFVVSGTVEVALTERRTRALW
ncbi:hypothetical protein H9P43_000171 [Blastocladiella emersonii ATCC 22665]|nr:hypothetical protein H9P43_000171 [Blastocladiella emersonii ATCC 22665]